MKTNITDFAMVPKAYGQFSVTYTSPSTGKKWNTVTTDAPLIDEVFHSEAPTQKALDKMKYICKNT
jgi:hypothetical protein